MPALFFHFSNILLKQHRKFNQSNISNSTVLPATQHKRTLNVLQLNSGRGQCSVHLLSRHKRLSQPQWRVQLCIETTDLSVNPIPPIDPSSKVYLIITQLGVRPRPVNSKFDAITIIHYCSVFYGSRCVDESQPVATECRENTAYLARHSTAARETTHRRRPAAVCQCASTVSCS